MLWDISLRFVSSLLFIFWRADWKRQPAIYAVIYGATVADHPKTIFVMSAILLYTAVSMLCRIRPFIYVRPEEAETGDAQGAQPYGELLGDVDTEDQEELPKGERGRVLERGETVRRS
jgi:hypothetical protein